MPPCGCRVDAEDVVDLMRACLLDKFADKASMLEIPRAGGRGKQARLSYLHVRCLDLRVYKHEWPTAAASSSWGKQVRTPCMQYKLAGH